jgi:hypothetical protein
MLLRNLFALSIAEGSLLRGLFMIYPDRINDQAREEVDGVLP